MSTTKEERIVQKSKEHSKGRKHNSPPRSPGGDQGSYYPYPYRNEYQLNMAQPKHPLYARILERKISKSMQKPLKFREYNGKGNPDEHMQLVND